MPTEQNEPIQPTRDGVTSFPIREEPDPVGAQSVEKLITPAQLGYVRKLITETGTDEDQLLDYFGFFTLDAIPRAEVNRVITALQGKRRAA